LRALTDADSISASTFDWENIIDEKINIKRKMDK
jgi:hypothetical protein